MINAEQVFIINEWKQSITVPGSIVIKHLKSIKMKNNIISITFVLLIIASFVQAQDQQETAAIPLSSKFHVYSVNFTTAYYSPQMDYWNDTYLPFVGVSETFGGNLVLGGNITFSLPANLRTRVGASYWSDEVAGNTGSNIAGLEIGLTRFNLGLLYAPEKIAFNGFQPYVGIEGQINLIKNKFDGGAEGTTTQQGQDMSFAPILGLDRTFGRIILGAEIKYNLGNYIQEVEMQSGIVENEVSINGPEFSLSVGYKF